MTTTPDLRALIESFATQLSQAMRRATLEEVHAKLTAAIDAPPQKKRGPDRPRRTATAAVPSEKARGKRTAADLGEMGEELLAHVKANPGQRGEQIAAALGTDVGTMRLPMKKLIAEKKVRTQGQRRGMQYFAGGGEPKRAARKAKHSPRRARRAKPSRRAKTAKRKKPVARATLIPRARPNIVEPAMAPVAVEPVPMERS